MITDRLTHKEIMERRKEITRIGNSIANYAKDYIISGKVNRLDVSDCPMLSAGIALSIVKGIRLVKQDGRWYLVKIYN